jgi:Holliday junction DNA helicase RuvA
MIDSLSGRVLAREPDLLLAVGPVVLRLEISEQTRARLPAPEGDATLHTVLQIREERVELLGFARPEERSLYRLLTAVSGVGKRLALAVLSELDVESLAQAVAQQDVARLTRVPGVGKKTASRLLLELGAKLDEFLPAEPIPVASARGDDPRREEAIAALTALGMNRAAALKALEQVEEVDAPLGVEELIRRALAAGVKA